MRACKRLLAALLFALCGAAAGCADGPSAPVVAAEVRVTATSTEIMAGQSIPLRVEVLDSRGRAISGRSVAWSSANASIATVASDGMVTGLAPGVVAIRATVDGVAGEVTLTVRPVPVASVSVSLDSATLTLGDSVQLVAMPRDASGNPLMGRSVAWSSSDTTVATVTAAGVVRAVRSGRATIIVASEGKEGSVRVVTTRGVVPDRLRLAAGTGFTCVLDAAGAAWCWGGNAQGQLGDGTTTTRLTAVAVTGGHTFRAISAGGSSVCGLKDAGEVYCWGQLLGTDSARSTTPVRRSAPLFQSLEVSDRHACGLTREGKVYCWGMNDYLQIGVPDFGLKPDPVVVTAEQRFVSISVSPRTSCALTAAGEAYCWGVFRHIDLAASYSEIPRRTPGNGLFSAVVPGYDYTCGIGIDGSTACWNKNTFGQLGTGSTTDAPTPAMIVGGVRMKALALSHTYSNIAMFTCGIATDDSSYCWGASQFGQIGSTAATERCNYYGGSITLDCSTSPKPVSGGLAASAIVTGDTHACMITRDRKIYCWGNNPNGQLGDGTTTRSTAPVLSRFNGVM